MRVKDLVGKDFENIDIKKMEAFQRLAAYRRKAQSLTHQIDVAENRIKDQVTKMHAVGLAYNATDPQYWTEGTNIVVTRLPWRIGDPLFGTFYVKDVPMNAGAIKFFTAMNTRCAYLQDQRNKIRRSMKGTRAAITRKG